MYKSQNVSAQYTKYTVLYTYTKHMYPTHQHWNFAYWPISRYLILSALLGPAGFLMATRQFQTTIRSLSGPVVIQKHQRTPILTHSFKKLRFWAKKWILTGLSGCLKLSNIWPKIHKNSDFGDFFGKERAFLRVSRVTTRRKSF